MNFLIYSPFPLPSCTMFNRCDPVDMEYTGKNIGDYKIFKCRGVYHAAHQMQDIPMHIMTRFGFNAEGDFVLIDHRCKSDDNSCTWKFLILRCPSISVLDAKQRAEFDKIVHLIPQFLGSTIRNSSMTD